MKGGIKKQKYWSASKANFQELKSTNRISGWKKAKDAVDLVCSGKTLQQCKDKIRNLNDVCKSTKDQNKKTGETSHS